MMQGKEVKPKTRKVNMSRHIHEVRMNGDFGIVLRKPDDVCRFQYAWKIINSVHH